MFFECDAGQDVAGRSGCEQQVADCHRGRQPEDDHESGHEGMPDAPVKAALGEGRRVVTGAPRVQVRLPQPEEVEMVDHEGRAEGHRPAGRVPGQQHVGARS